MSGTAISFIGFPVTDHGGTLDKGPDRYTNVEYQGTPFLVALDGDKHICPLHGINTVHGSGFAKYEGIKVVRVGDTCDCGATVIVGSTVETNTEGA